MSGNFIRIYVPQQRDNQTEQIRLSWKNPIDCHIHMTIYHYGEDFDLHYVDIYEGDYIYHVDWESSW